MHSCNSSNLATQELVRVGAANLILINFAVIIYYVWFGSLTWRLKHGVDFRNGANFITRVEWWIKYYSQFNFPKLIGIGPTKTIILSYPVDNEWLIFLKKFGVLGTIYIGLSLVLPVLKSILCRYKGIYLAIIYGGAFFMITSVFINIHQVMPSIIILATLARQELSIRRPITGENSIYYKRISE